MGCNSVYEPNMTLSFVQSFSDLSVYNVEKISPKKYLVDITASDLLMKFFVNWIWQHLRTIVKVTETNSALGNKPSVLIKLKPLLLCRKFILKPS